MAEELTTPSYQVAGSTSAPRSPKRTRTALFIVGFVLLLIVASLLPTLTRPFRDAQSVKDVSALLPGAEFFRDAVNGTIVYVIKDGAFVTQESGPLIIASVATAGGTFRVVRVADGSYEITHGGATILQSKLAIASLDATPDGRYVTYALQHADAAPITFEGGILQFEQLKTSEWDTVLYDVTTKKATNLGEGVQPFFLDATHVVRTTAAGIYLSEVSTGAATLLLEKRFVFVSATPLVAPDRTHMGAVVDGSAAVSLFVVSRDAAKEIASLPILDGVTSYTLGTNELYQFRTKAFGTEVWCHAFDASSPQRVATLPETLLASRVSLMAYE